MAKRKLKMPMVYKVQCPDCGHANYCTCEQGEAWAREQAEANEKFCRESEEREKH